MQNRISRMETARTDGGSPFFACPRFANEDVDGPAKIGTVPELQGVGPQPIGAVLAELLAQYQARFPQVRITVVETPAVAI